mgnify:CR=1 FL=1
MSGWALSNTLEGGLVDIISWEYGEDEYDSSLDTEDDSIVSNAEFTVAFERLTQGNAVKIRLCHEFRLDHMVDAIPCLAVKLGEIILDSRVVLRGVGYPHTSACVR